MHAEWDKLNKMINHNRDENFTYAGLQQVVDKYLVQDRSSGDVYETPQFMYILIAQLCLLSIQNKLEYNTSRGTIMQFQHLKSTFLHCYGRCSDSIRQFASCVLVDVDDTLNSIFNSDSAIGYYVSQRAGIGINAGRIRGINSKIRGGEVQHTGVIPFLKSSKQLYVVVHRMASEVVQLQLTFLSGIKKSTTSLY